MKPSPLLLTILAALSAAGCETEETTMCLDVADDIETCPAAEDVDADALFSQSDCDLEARAVLGDGYTSAAFGYGRDTGEGADLLCCYPVRAVDRSPMAECAIGRPYLESDAPVVAPLRPGHGWCDGPTAAKDEDNHHAALAEAWLSMARMEHASVAAFARLTLELMACGAPAALLAAVQQAALDEVHHAEACFRLAARFSGEARSPGPLPITAPIQPSGVLTALAVAAVREGCLGETLGAALAAEAAVRAVDPDVRAVLTRIAADEARHAALSWRIVGWAVRAGGEAVRQAVAAAFQQPMVVSSALAVEDPQAEGLGALGPAATAAVCARTWRQVVQPARRILLAA